jgi:hypothetical protein
MAKSKANPTVANMTLEELKGLVKQVIEQERRRDCYVDDDGYLVFYTEEGYADYLEKVGKRPSRVKAYWIGEGGLKFHYSDYELSEREKRRLARIHKDIAEGQVIPGEVVLEGLRRRLQWKRCVPQ